jgi:hypothetical protein
MVCLTVLTYIDDALLKQVALARLKHPAKHDLRVLRSWFGTPTMGDSPLWGIDRGSWNTEHENDLAALMPRERQDAFSNWVAEKVTPAFHHAIGSKFKVQFSRFPKGSPLIWSSNR